MQSVKELEENLSSYREQLNQVNELLAADPENEELKEMANGLDEVIQLTQELLAATLSAEPASASQEPFLEEPPPIISSNYSPSTVSPSQNASEGLLVGSKVKAVWSEDGEWYDATIESITPNGYIVVYDNYGNKEEVDIGNIRVVEQENESKGKAKEVEKEGEEGEDIIATAEEIAERTRLELKRKIEEAGRKLEIVPKELPPKLRIHPDDTEEVRAAKRKKIHAFKSKQRLEVLETTQNKRQNAWQQFQSAGKKKPVGYFTGRKKESIFKSPDDPTGKVGVTRSGHGMTEFQKREKYLNLKRGEENE